jgi:hypothetical protein
LDTTGIRYTKKKVLWWKVYIPTGFDWDPYTDGGIINETASYAGPSEWVVLKSMPGLESSSASVSVTPTAYIEPRLYFNDLLYVGIRGSIGEEFKFTLYTQNVANQWYPNIHGVGTATRKASVDATTGVSFVVPIVNYRKDWSKSFNIWKSGDTPDYTWKAF